MLKCKYYKITFHCTCLMEIFSFSSITQQVLFRLNFLVVVLCIVMDRSYQFYYFVPLVTVWFMIIYVTLALWPQIVQKKANGNFFSLKKPFGMLK